MIEIHSLRVFGVPFYSGFCSDCGSYIKSGVHQFSWVDKRSVIQAARIHIEQGHPKRLTTSHNRRMAKTRKVGEIA